MPDILHGSVLVQSVHTYETSSRQTESIGQGENVARSGNDLQGIYTVIRNENLCIDEFRN
ncbi:hypothetical protein DNL72_24225 [Salmonella enterica subsp. enterica serovar Infantis]|nr:hypothetical protein [Salmonella enterica subsp. enterica serovar Infantis]EBY8437195.1 hypothetical protein [Salmonella enterica subsp. enterica serovar Thompson]ECE8511344.1 hypothetical protein [Salmonella enterica subsp. enterica serovar Enteritidis]RFR89532.1 hypothetical protein CRD87_00010 [Salmonella enterica subsp. enterica serovar Poona]